MLKYTCLIVCFSVGFCTAAYVETLSKCSYKDDNCLKELYPSIIGKIATTGLDELKIPVLEPLTIDGTTISFLGLLNITITKGTASGVSKCTFDVFTADLEKGFGHQENTCSLTIEGQYEINASPIISSVLGPNGISGNGNLKVLLDQAHITFDFPAYVQKRDDGETYIKVEYENIKYKMDIKGGVQIDADNIQFGSVETSKTLIPFLNANWKFLLDTFGTPILDVATKIYFNIVGKFFENVATKYYIIEDLSSIAKA